MPVPQPHRTRMLDKLRLLYGDAAESVLERIDALADRHAGPARGEGEALWDERSVVLITYGDQVRSPAGSGEAALESQRRFLLDAELDRAINAVHILPFFPYSSDDGFSVIDYRRVDAAVGDWPDVDRLGESFRLAFDFVVNHCSQQNAWFERYLAGEAPYTEYFIDDDPATDLSAVTRPRSSPLLTPFETADRGTRHVWTTFSADQVDLNFASPHVLLEALEILLEYIGHGARIIRLDAIGFLWKRVGTNCMHLAETHAVVKLMRDLVDAVAPGTVLLTETNVPHEENVSYFGQGDEAHMVYQFSLAPLLLDAMLTGDAEYLNAWLEGLEYPGTGMTYFNFTASHDGIGVRPLEGLVPQARLDGLVEAVRGRGGRVGLRRQPDGSETPYELNITYVSALDLPEGLPPELHAGRFLTAQGLMLALRGVPGIYFHSLVGTRNFSAGVEQTGHNRTINRRKFDREELAGILAEEGSLEQRIFDGYRKMLAVRIAQRAFHPDAPQQVHRTSHRSLVALTRTSTDGEKRLLVLTNVGDSSVKVNLAELDGIDCQGDLLSGTRVDNGTYDLPGHSIAWLA